MGATVFASVADTGGKAVFRFQEALRAGVTDGGGMMGKLGRLGKLGKIDKPRKSRKSRKLSKAGKTGKTGKRLMMGMAAMLLATVVFWGCSPYSGIGLQQQIRIADRRLEWGLVYFNSWLQQGESRYLDLARDHTAHAVVDYFEIQLALGHAWPQFYDLDKRRRRGCRFLSEIDRAAFRNRIELGDRDREGCLP